MRHQLSKKRALMALGLTVAAVCAAGFSATAASAATTPTRTIHSAAANTTVKFGYTGQATTWTVPAGVTSINLEAAGGTGGNFGANLGTSG